MMATPAPAPFGPPPFVDPTIPAVEFEAPGTATRFRSQNSARPETEITLTGPQSSSYFVGLAIVPIVLIALLAVWVICMIGVGCAQNRIRGCLRRKVKHPSRLWPCVALLLLGSLVGWICAFAYSVSALAYDDDLRNDIAALETGVKTVNAALDGTDNHTAQVLLTMEDVKEQCGSSNVVVNAAVLTLDVAVKQTVEKVSSAIGSARPATSEVASSISTYSSSISTYLRVRTIVTSVLSGIMMVVVLILLLIALLGTGGRSRSISYIAGGCGIRQCCNPLVGVTVLAAVLMMALAAVLHAIALAVSDLCAPNVNTSINRIAGEFLDYSRFAEFEGYNLTEMCFSIDSVEEWKARPIELSFLCFYQTCDPQNPYVDVVLRSIQTSVALIEAANKQTTTIMDRLDPLLPENACAASIRALVPDYAAILSDSSAALTFLSCPSMNKLYASAVYDSVCQSQLEVAVHTFDSWLSGTVLFMAGMSLWLTCRSFLHQDQDSDGDEAATVKEIFRDDHNYPRSPRSAVVPSPRSTTLPVSNRPYEEGVSDAILVV